MSTRAPEARTPPGETRTDSASPWWWLAAAAAALLVVMLLAVWQGRAYVDYSDGVYAASARLVLHGHTPYRDFAAAQPPGVYLAGAAVLALGDSALALRHGLAVIDLILDGLVAAVVVRLTGRRAVAAGAGLVSLLTPWALLDHAQLLPETFGAPLLAGSILAAGRRRGCALAGALCGLACAFKVAFALPAVAIAAAAAAPAVAFAAFGATLAIELVASGIGFGSGFWHQVFQAQSQTGLAGLHYAAGLPFQALWNLLPLLVPAALALRLRPRGPIDPQFRVLVVGAVASLGLLLSVFKQGSYLNVAVAVEPPLVMLAACGWAWALPPGLPPRRSPAVLAMAVAAALGVAESASLVVAPRSPALFGRPLATSGPGWQLTSGQVDRAVRAAARCPRARAYSGSPYLAFAAHRRTPGNQPDQFIITHAAADARFLARADADRDRCG